MVFQHLMLVRSFGVAHRSLATALRPKKKIVKKKNKSTPKPNAVNQEQEYEQMFNMLDQDRRNMEQSEGYKSIVPEESRLWSNNFGYESAYQAAGHRILEGLVQSIDDPNSAVKVQYERMHIADLDEESLKMLKKVSGLTDERIEAALEAEKELDDDDIAAMSDLDDYAALSPEERDRAFRRLCSIAIVGTPNSGKSTLLNILVKNHVFNRLKIFNH
jgi:DNA replication protein DnaC